MVANVLGLICGLLAPFWLVYLLFGGTFGSGIGVVSVPLIFLLNVVLIQRVSVGDPALRKIMMVGLLLKFFGCAAAEYMFFNVYGGGDLTGTFETGRILITQLHDTGRYPFLYPFWSQNFVNMFTSLLMLFVGFSFPAIAVIYASFGYWGEYFFYRAFCREFPASNRYLAATLMFFLPSIVYWTAPMGKDSTIYLGLGIAVCGFSLSRHALNAKGWLMFAFGMALTGLVRPHIGAMLGIAFTGPYLFGSHRQGLWGTLSKIVGIPLLAGLSFFMISEAKQFVLADNVGQAMNRMKTIRGGLEYGGSAYNESTPVRIALAPVLVFRPFPWEVRSAQMAVASMEGAILLLFFVRRGKRILSLIRSWRQHPLILCILIFGLQFTAIFAWTSANFGTLTRQRVMLLPFLLMLPCGVAAGVARRVAPAYMVRRPMPINPPAMQAEESRP